MKRVLLTGASGFVGQQCIPLLMKAGYEIIAISRNKHSMTAQNTHFEAINLLNIEKTQKLINNYHPEYLLHLAWYAKPGSYWEAEENYQWVNASLNILKAFAGNGGKRVVFAGTCAEYDWRYGYLNEELTPLQPITTYGTCKLSLQKMVESYGRQHDLSYAWARLFYMYGEHEHPSRLVPGVCQKLLQNETVQVWHGNQIRDFLNVKDVACALVGLLNNDLTGPVNVCSGKPVAIREIVRCIADILDKHDLVRYGAVPRNTNDPALLVGDPQLLIRSLGWQPEISLTQGLDSAIAFWRKQLTV